VSNNGPVKIQYESGLATDGAASNVATNQATAEALKAAGNIDGKTVYPEWVTSRGITVTEGLRVGSGVTLTDGCVEATHLASDSVTASKLNATSVTASELSLSGTLRSFNISNLGSIDSGSLAVGAGGVSVGDSSAGIYIGGNQIYAKTGGVATVLIDGSTGVITATAFQYTGTEGGGSFTKIKNSGGTTIVQLDATNGIMVNNAASTPNILERYSIAYGGTEYSWIANTGGTNIWYGVYGPMVVQTGGGSITLQATGAGDGVGLYTNGGTITLSGGPVTTSGNSLTAGAISGSSLSTSGAISCGTSLDMTQGAISNATTISGTNCAVYALHLARDSSYKGNTTFTFYAASSSGGATTVLHTVTFKDGLITSWSAA